MVSAYSVVVKLFTKQFIQSTGGASIADIIHWDAPSAAHVDKSGAATRLPLVCGGVLGDDDGACDGGELRGAVVAQLVKF